MLSVRLLLYGRCSRELVHQNQGYELDTSTNSLSETRPRHTSSYKNIKVYILYDMALYRDSLNKGTRQPDALMINLVELNRARLQGYACQRSYNTCCVRVEWDGVGLDEPLN